MSPRWHLEVQDSFMITGRGLVVLGILHGVAQQGEAAVVRTQDGSFRVEHAYFDIPRRRGPDIFAISFKGVKKDQVPVGAVVEAVD